MKIKTLDQIHSKGSFDLAATFRIAEIHRNIKNRAEKLEELQAKITREIQINVSDTIIEGKLVHLLSVDGVSEGVSIYDEDIQSGRVTMEQGYQQLAEIVERSPQLGRW